MGVVHQQGGNQTPSVVKPKEQLDHHIEPRRQTREDIMKNLARNFPLFSGKSSQNAHLHVQQLAKLRDPKITEVEMNELEKMPSSTNYKRNPHNGTQGTN